MCQRDDTISRQAAIDAFYEMASNIDYLCTVDDYVHVLETLSTSEPKNRTETHACDLISRQAVLKLLSTMPPEEAMTKAMLIQSVKQMDAVQPERKRGRWTPNIYPDVGDGYRCSQCGAYHVVPYKFCHNCGADMREVNDERSD